MASTTTPDPDETPEQAHQRADDDYDANAGARELRGHDEDPRVYRPVVLPASWRPRRKH